MSAIRRRLITVLACLGAALHVEGQRAARAADLVLVDNVQEYRLGEVRLAPLAGIVFAFRNEAVNRTDPAVAWTTLDGQRGGQLNPLTVFPSAERIDIWDVAAGPGVIAVAAVVQSGEKSRGMPPRHVLLVYDLAGKLRAQWHLNPYHHHEIAIDRGGNVYGLGHRIDGPASNLVIQYSPDGVVTREFLPASLFPDGAGVVHTDGRSGPNDFWVDDRGLVAYLGKTQELFEYDLDGVLQRRTSLRDSLSTIASQAQASQLEVMTVVRDESGTSVLLQVRLFVEGKVSFDLARVVLAPKVLVRTLPLDDREIAAGGVRLLGQIGGSMVFFDKDNLKMLRRRVSR